MSALGQKRACAAQNRMSCSIGLTPLTAGEALLDVSASSFLDFTGHQFLDSVAPLFERFSLLGRERVQLINADDAGEGATMDLFDHYSSHGAQGWRHLKLLERRGMPVGGRITGTIALKLVVQSPHF